MIENSVVSCPPCWLAVETNAAPTLPLSAPDAHSPPRLIEERRQLRRDAAEARAGADDDRVVVGEFGDGGDLRLLVELEMVGARDLLGHRLGHATDRDLGAGTARALGDGFGHLLDVAVGRIIENQYLRHRHAP